MKDFDFDELDRAVNSVLAKKQQAASQDQPGDDQMPADNSMSSTTQNDQVEAQPHETGEVIESRDVSEQTLQESESTQEPPEQQEPYNDPMPNTRADSPSSQVNDDNDNTTEPSDNKKEDESATPVDSSYSENDTQATFTDVQPAPDQKDSEQRQDDSTVENVDNTDDTVASDETSDIQQPSEAASKPNRGRFMDVVRPIIGGVPVEKTPVANGDAEDVPESKSDKPRLAPSRSGVKLEPSQDFNASQPAIDVGSALDDETQEQKESINTLHNTHHHAGENEPNNSNDEQPVDSNSKNVETDAQPSASQPIVDHGEGVVKTELSFEEKGDETSAVQANSDSSPQEAQDSTNSTNEKHSTPFLADVAVSKRPLNQSEAAQSAQHNDTAEPIEQPTHDANGGQPPRNDETATPESNKEILSAESQEPAPSATLHQEKVPVPNPVSQPAAAAFQGTPSIPQQYKTAEEKTDSEHHPVFDAHSYQQPLHDDGSHVSHRLMWASIIIGLFLVGVAIGVLYFLYRQ